MTEAMIRKQYKKRYLRGHLLTLLIAALVLVLAGAMLLLGNTFYSPLTVLKVLMGDTIKGASFAVGTIRLPRMLAGLVAGMAFGMAGSAFQIMLRNPMASPDIIGITSGSSAAAVFCIMVLHAGSGLTAIASVVSGLGVALLIFALSGGGHFFGGRLILIGIGISAMLRSVISYLMLRGSQYDVPGAMRWLSGSLNGVQMDEISLLVVLVPVFGMALMLLERYLRILALGEQSAISLGVTVAKVRLMIVISSVVLIAFATAVTGPIAFISFLAGPITKRLVGTSYGQILPSGLVGALMVLLGDIIGSHLFPVQYPVGVVTGIIGAPYLIYLLIRLNKRGGAA